MNKHLICVRNVNVVSECIDEFTINDVKRLSWSTLYNHFTFRSCLKTMLEKCHVIGSTSDNKTFQHWSFTDIRRTKKHRLNIFCRLVQIWPLRSVIPHKFFIFSASCYVRHSFACFALNIAAPMKVAIASIFLDFVRYRFIFQFARVALIDERLTSGCLGVVMLACSSQHSQRAQGIVSYTVVWGGVEIDQPVVVTWDGS